MKLFNCIALKRRCNTLENKLHTEIENTRKDKEKLLEMQDKYISLLEKVVDIDKLHKELKKNANDIKIKEKNEGKRKNNQKS